MKALIDVHSHLAQYPNSARMSADGGTLCRLFREAFSIEACFGLQSRDPQGADRISARPLSRGVKNWILNRPGIGAGPMVLAALLLFLTAGTNLAADPRLRILKTPDGIRFGLIGAKPAAPSPTVFFLGGGVEDSLSEPQYIEAQNEFGPGVLHVTIDLPGHGAERREGQPASLRGWRYRLDQGEDLIADVVRRATAVLDHLVRERYTDPAKVGAFGTSRGGFMAFHFAAAEPRIRHIAAFAPVTDLLALGEFFGMPHDHRARAIAATTLAGRLADRGIWIIIGSTDHRVSTDRAMEFTQRVIEAAEARGRRPSIELHIQTTDGHRVPDGCYGEAARWLRKQWQVAIRE